MKDLYLVDGHMHLEYGDLSEEYVMEFVDEAVRKGLDEICILDHSHRFVEFKPCYEHLRIYPLQSAWLDKPTHFNSSLDDYHKLIDRMKKKDLPIKVSFGLEVCYTYNTERMLREILAGHDFDFLTGAIHSFDFLMYDLPISKALLWDRFSADDIYREYFAAVMRCVNSGVFDRLAHPDTIKMNNVYPTNDLTDTYAELAKALKQNGMIAECNTGVHYRYGHKDIGLSDELLDILLKEGVEIITASDAHKPEEVGNFIKEATLRIKERQLSLMDK